MRDRWKEGYYRALSDMFCYINKMKDGYSKGTMCSMSESIWGESICDDILKYIDKLHEERRKED